MEKVSEKLEAVKAWSARPRTKKRIYLALVVLIALWFVYRFVMVGMQNRIYVFNPARQAADTGQVVEVIQVQKTDGFLKEPLTVKNNRAMVSGARVHLLHAGQRVGDGVIVSVSQNIDLDTGMHAVRTRGVADGLNYVECPISGYFIPSYAVEGNIVFVADGDIAAARMVAVARSDAETTVISDGLSDGDAVILSSVSDGAKIQIKK